MVLSKMRLILEYNGLEHTVPFEYESEEALLLLFDQELSKAIKNNKVKFAILGKEFWTDDFYFFDEYENQYTRILPDIMILDQWFELNKGCEWIIEK